MAFKNCRLSMESLAVAAHPLQVDCRLNRFARAARFGVRRSAIGRIRRGEPDAAFATPFIVTFELQSADRRLPFQLCAK
jgi:hypothetical protein